MITARKKMSELKYQRLIFIIFNLFVFSAVLIWFLGASKNLPKANISIEDFKMKHVIYNDDNHSFQIDGETKDNSQSKEIIWGPFSRLKAGSYTAIIKYSSETDQSCFASAYGQEAKLIKSTNGILSKYLHSVAYDFEASENINEFNFSIIYNGYGDFEIQSISIVPNNNRIKRITVELIFLALLADCMMWFLRQPEPLKKNIFSLFLISVLISIPLMIKGIFSAPDIEFHLLRIEAIVQALRSGQFPARISSISMYGLGYPFSIFYNDLFLYFPAFLRILGFSVTSSYKIFVFFVNLITVGISFFSFKCIFHEDDLAILLSLLYTSAAYRLNCIYVRAGVGEYCAMVFFPLLALSLYKIYTSETDKIKSIVENSILLSLSFSGIIGSHILSLVIIVFMMIILFLILYKKTFRKQTLSTFLCAGIITILLNVYFLIPFLDYYFNVPITIRELLNDNTLIQDGGISPIQFFTFFRYTHTKSTPNGIDHKLMHSPGLPLISIFIAAQYFFLVKRIIKKKFLIYLFFSLLSLWISTDLFPWNFLTLHIPLWIHLAKIQYPWRFLSVSILFLTLEAGELLKNFNSFKTHQLLIYASILNTVLFSSILFYSRETIDFYDSSSLDKDPKFYDYFITGSTFEYSDTEIQGTGMKSFDVVSRNSNTLTLFCDTGYDSGIHTVIAPLFNYPGYHVFDQFENEYKIFTGKNNHVAFDLPDQFKGIITITFKDPGYWTSALIISIISACSVLIFSLLSKKRGDRNF